MTEFLCTLKNPSNNYRSHPFWSWNDKLDPDELRRQVRAMKEAGLGGYFMHARGGLKTEYLSDEWFDCISSCIDEGEKNNIDSWCYDENGWPSGFGGGAITAMGDEYHVRNLTYGLVGEKDVAGTLIAYYSISNSGQYRCFGTDLKMAKDYIKTDEKLYFIAHQKNPYYVDILNPKVVKAFIDHTYGKYYDKYKKEFSNGKLKGFFTDEPQFSRGKIPWSYVFTETFEKINSYSPVDHLICLFKDVNGAEKFRYDFWSVINKLYTESYGKQIYDWCCEKNCKWTGHSMLEDSLFTQMQCTAGVMPIYEYLHIPGVDWLTRGISSPVIPKQVGSVAAQLGKKQVLSEIFALSGWDVSLEELKWMAEWQFVNGVNLLCPHLESYSIKGMRKRDYPPSLFTQSPWWDEYKLFNLYISRLGQLLANGKEIVDTLVIHPMKNGWITYNGSNNDRLKALDKSLENISMKLSGWHIPYHYGDETIIAEHCKVEDDKFIVGEQTYKFIILPEMETIDESTFNLLNTFAGNGGKIYSFGKHPYRINGRIDSKIKQLNEKLFSIPFDKELRNELLVNDNIKTVTITDNFGEIENIHCMIRDFGDGFAYFFVNLDNKKSYNAAIKLINGDPAIGYKLETQTPYTINCSEDEIYLHFEPMQSHIVLTGNDLPDVMKKENPTIDIPLSNEWTVESSSENMLTLDMCSYAVNDGLYSEYKPVLGVMDELLAKKTNNNISLKYEFYISEDTDLEKINDLKLVTEYEGFDIKINDREIRHDLVSWWKDKSFKLINIKDVVLPGRNEITIDGAFKQDNNVYEVLFGTDVHETEINKLTYDTEIESIYIIGDFSVFSESKYISGERKTLHTNGGFYLTNKNVTLKGGEIVTQGYPFFAGKIKLSQNFKIKKRYGKCLSIDIGKPNAAAVNVFVNDVFVKTLMWSEFKVDVSDYIIKDDNKITLEIVTGNRNMFGPHHHPEGESYAVHPRSFGPNGNYSSDSWRSRYTFVKTGV